MPVQTPSRFRVALLIETSNRYGRDLLHGVHDWVRAGANWSVRLTEQSRLAPLPQWLRHWQGDGIIARVDSPAIAAALRRTGLPVVDVSAERLKSEFPRVSIDNVAVARLAAAHLSSKGLRQFAFCGDPGFLWSDERGRSFAAILRGMGFRCHTFGLGRVRKRKPAADDEMQAITDWLAALPKPVGVFACYDGRAQQVVTACQHLGVTVPGDVAVLGVDNDEVLCELSDPPLSSVLPNARRAGYEAAAILTKLMARDRAAARISLAIEPLRVVERQSTDTLSVADARLAAAVRIVRHHATDGINVADLLRKVPMSRTHLEQRFKAHFGVSPHRMIKTAKIARARELLLESDLPIARIADLAGFESPSYLSAAFRRKTGESPLAFRRKLRAGARPIG